MFLLQFNGAQSYYLNDGYEVCTVYDDALAFELPKYVFKKKADARHLMLRDIGFKR